MIGSFRNHWEYTPSDIWEPLAAHESVAPDLFNDLYDAVDEFLSLPTSDTLLEEIRNDAVKAHDAFCTGVTGVRSTFLTRHLKVW
jgi:hypothetical protein